MQIAGSVTVRQCLAPCAWYRRLLWRVVLAISQQTVAEGISANVCARHGVACYVCSFANPCRQTSLHGPTKRCGSCLLAVLEILGHRQHYQDGCHLVPCPCTPCVVAAVPEPCHQRMAPVLSPWTSDPACASACAYSSNTSSLTAMGSDVPGPDKQAVALDLTRGGTNTSRWQHSAR